jgi:rhodanese-related sulfurtransferase
VAARIEGMSDFPLHIDVHSVRDLLESGDTFVLLDCREPHEHALVRIDGSRHVPMNHIPTRVDELNPFRHQRIVVYCHHGVRSLQVTQWLREHGFDRAQNMMGGIDVWSLVVDTGLPRY